MLTSGHEWLVQKTCEYEFYIFYITGKLEIISMQSSSQKSEASNNLREEYSKF